MSVVIKDMGKPQYCFLCMFGLRINNGHVACSLHPIEPAVSDGESVPEHCPIQTFEGCDIFGNNCKR